MVYIITYRISLADMRGLIAYDRANNTGAVYTGDEFYIVRSFNNQRWICAR